MAVWCYENYLFNPKVHYQVTYTEPIHEKSLSEYTATLDKSDCLENKNSDDADIIQDKMPCTDSKEIIRSSIRSKKLPTSRNSDFFYGRSKYKQS